MFKIRPSKSKASTVSASIRIKGSFGKTTLPSFIAQILPENLKSAIYSKKSFSNIPKDFIEARVQEAKQVFKDNFLKSCWTFIAFNPIWCIFYTTAALIRAGGRNYIGAIATLLSQGLAFVWLIVITLYFKPFFPQTFNLPLAYFVFFLFDFVRWGIFEIFQWKFDWKGNITHETISNIKNNL